MTEKGESTLTEAVRRRRVKTTKLGSYVVPGYCYEDLEDEGRTEVYWYGDRTIRITAVAVSAKDHTDVPP